MAATCDARRAAAVVAATAAIGVALASPAMAEPPARAASAGPTRYVDYLAIEANEGGSSGGHAAIRFGDETYHFQHESPGILRLTRRDSADFVADYAILQNRGIRVSRVAVSGATFRRLRDAFNERWLAQEREVAELAALRRDGEVLAGLLAARRAADSAPAPGAGADPGDMPSIEVPAAGLFAVDALTSRAADPAQGARTSPAVARLRDRIARERGGAFLAERRTAIDGELAAALAASPTEPGADAGGVSDRYLDRWAMRIGLQAIAAARPVRDDAARASGSPDLALGDTERRWLERWAGELEAQLVALAASDRRGSGVALLVGLARLDLLRQSLESGRLVVVDAYPEGARRLDADALRRQRGLLPELLDEAREDLRRSRAVLPRDGAPREADWTRVETAANRMLELERAIAFGRELRLAPGAMVPSRAARLLPPVVPEAPAERLAAALGAANVAERDARDALLARHAYHLVTHNCVTEIFRVIDAALTDGSGAEIGGRVAPDGGLRFVPIVSEAAVREEYRVVEGYEIASQRARRLDELAARDGAAWAALRESTTLGSELYRGQGDRDSIFLFFTDVAPALSPVLGAMNLAVGVGASVAGVALAPLDGGRTLSGGLRGTLFSLPELAFVDIRKGSFDHVPRRERPRLADLDPALADGDAVLPAVSDEQIPD